MRTVLLLALGSLAAAAASDPAPLPLPAPSRVELYLDGARLIQTVAAPAGRSRILVPTDAGELIGVDGADSWVVQQRIDSIATPPMPRELVALTTLLQGLLQRQEQLGQDQETCQRLEGDLTLRLSQRGLGQHWEIDAWQTSLDGLLAMHASLTARAVALEMDRRGFQERCDREAAPGLTFAQVLGDQVLSGAVEIADPATLAQRLWQAATTRSQETRVLVITRAQPGPVTVVSERTDMAWVPQARVLVAHGAATFVRQATIHVPAGLALPGVPARMIGGPRAQHLAGVQAQPRWVAAGTAPEADRRSVRVTTEAADWDQANQPVASREQTWELPALTLRAPAAHDAEVIAELQKNAVPIVADEWVLAPAIAPVLVRRLSVRMDAHPLAAGVLELVVDGTVLGRDRLPDMPAGSLLQLQAGEDQRVFVADTKTWDEDPNRPPNHKRTGTTYRIRNLSAEAVHCIGYLTHPVSAAKEVTVTIDPATTPKWTEPQPGILRWELTIAPGQEMPFQAGWVIDASGKIRL